MKAQLMIAFAALSLAACQQQRENRYMVQDYPDARRDTTVVDDYFGLKVADPYRWLENDTSDETAAWVEAQRALTNDYLSHITFRDKLKERLKTVMNYARTGCPYKRGEHWFVSRNNGLQNQSVIYMFEGDDIKADAPTKVVLDPNTLSDDGTVALAGFDISKDGRYLAYAIARNGSDWNEIYVKDLETMQLLDDHIEWAKFGGPSWHGDGFYYSAYDAPTDGHAYSGKNENHRVYFHRLGTQQSEDKVAYENPAQPMYFHNLGVDEDERFVFLSESGQGSGSTLYIKDTKRTHRDVRTGTPADKGFTLIGSYMDCQYDVIDIIGDTLYMVTNEGAPRGRLIAAPVATPDHTHWRNIIPEGENVLDGVQRVKDHFIVSYTQDANDHCYLYTLDGKMEREIEFPTFGSVGFSTDRNDERVFYSFTSFVYPTTIYSYDLATGQSTEWAAPQVDLNPEDYTTTQIFFTSKDGTNVPMFVTHKKGLQMDGKNPCLIYGYGGFNISLPPSFSTNRLPWLENGGIYVQVNLRGGNEYGENWHLEGTKMYKQNVFDDFIAAAEYLQHSGYTSPAFTAIMGGSNGGLLIGAVVNQRPELYAVAIPQVGVMDMMRYHRFTIGWNWAPDYGTSDDSKEMAEYLHGYSPLHTIKSGADVHYPAILVTTADHDDRVVPAHSFKYAATLQYAQTGPEPKLIRIDSKAGHGGGKPIGKIIEEQADIYSFIMYNMGLTY